MTDFVGWFTPTTPVVVDPDKYWDREIYLVELVDNARSPGWYEASCVACYWHTTGSEPVVEMAFEEHKCENYPEDRG
jgi:hypothetical protein